MDWSNERYVRLYTRDTPEWLWMAWQGRALWPLLIRKIDRAGVLATKLGSKGVAVLVGLPSDVVEVGVQALIEDGCLEIHDLGYVVPNFITAQEARSSDRMRQTKSRESYRGVTKRDRSSRVVTEGHQSSRLVTPSLAEPSLANKRVASATRVLAHLSSKNGVTYRKPDTHLKLIVARLEEDITEPELISVVDHQAKAWMGDPKMRGFVRPQTLFGKESIHKYLGPATSKTQLQLSTGMTVMTTHPEEEWPAGVDLFNPGGIQ